MHLFFDPSTLPASPLLEDLLSLIRSVRGRVHAAVPDETASILRREGLSPDDCTLLGTTPEAHSAARQARVRFARVRTAADWEPAWPLDADFADLAEALEWFRRHAQLERCGWPIATVGGLVFRPDGKAFFVRTAKWSGKWGTPGGKIDYGESHVAAFVREIREETGLETDAPKLVLVQEAVEDPDFHKPRHFLLLNLVGRTGQTGTVLNHESLEGRWMDLDEALACDLNRPTLHLVRHLLDHPGDLP
jgi:ADP-ribose pyrophosphatase YjhB (NUDIX family)